MSGHVLRKKGLDLPTRPAVPSVKGFSREERRRLAFSATSCNKIFHHSGSAPPARSAHKMNSNPRGNAGTAIVRRPSAASAPPQNVDVGAVLSEMVS